jgi:hypothetical protein
MLVLLLAIFGAHKLFLLFPDLLGRHSLLDNVVALTIQK